MYGGGGKLGRGGSAAGRGAVKRHSTPLSSFHNSQTPPLHHRPSSAAGRLPGGPRNRPPTSSAAAAPSTGTEERFSLVRGNHLNFGMIVKLTPDFVEEIKRAEEIGAPARIKFDANANNTSGNVIDVGGKNFRFTWAREVGDLCDIYEERENGENGDGLLIESGCAWRKLNVQRVLDESTKNHVKKRSEEAERQQKSRKAIVLEAGNPSMKNQMKAVAAAEATSWRKPFQTKKEPELKKRKIDPPPGPNKSGYKSGLPSTTTITNRPSISPSPPQYSGASASPFFAGNMTKSHTSAEDLLSNQPMMRENVITSEKEKHNKTNSSIVQEKSRRKGSFDKSMDLQSMLITLLKENPKGMTLKALEKAVGDSVPNSIKKIEPVIKKIATFQAPGRYILKPGVELGSLKKPLSESGSSPDNGQQTPAVEEKHEDASTLTPNFPQKKSDQELEKQALLNLNFAQEMSPFDDVDIQRPSPDPFGENKNSENNEDPAHSSSNSGSDSESDSSDSGGDSKGKSKSPVKSGSLNSSDSDSDASSNSKQGPDEDVDIISEDEESKPNIQISEPNFSTSPLSFADFDATPTQNRLEENQNNGSEPNFEQDVPDDIHQTALDADTDPHAGYIFSERENFTKDVSKNDQSRNHEKSSKNKSKRGSDSKPSGHSKKLKTGNLPQPILSESPQIISSERVVEEPYRGRSSQMTNLASRDVSADYIRKCDNQGLNGKSSIDNQNSGRRPSNPSSQAGASDKFPENMEFGVTGSGNKKQSQERYSNFKDNNRNNMLKASKESVLDQKTPVVMGRGKMLRRELSDLELGEFREPLPEKKLEEKKLERKGSFKETENRPSSSDYWNSDLNMGRPNFRPGVLSNVEGPNKRIPENQTQEIVRPPNRVLQSRAEIGNKKSGDTSGKIRHIEARENQENGVDGVGDIHTNLSASLSKHNDVGRGPVSHPKREIKTQKLNSYPDPAEVKKDASLTESSEGVLKRRESSSDENSCSFSKYEKEEPDLKGPIKDFSQYKEYVQEYQEKYDSYCSLNKTLESYRNEFYKLGKDLERTKGRDMEKYYQIMEQLQESYRQCGNRHKRLKKIFVVLHEELKRLKEVIKDYAASYASE